MLLALRSAVAPGPSGRVAARVIKFSSTSAGTLEGLLAPLYLDGWRAAVYGNGFLILEKGI